MSQPQIVFFALFAVIVAAAIGAVIWGAVAGRRKQAAEKGKALPKPGKAGKPGKVAGKGGAAAKGATPPPARKAPTVKLSEKQLSALERKFAAARKQFSKVMDKRIAREPIIGERLRRNRDMVMGWYEQKGKVVRLRYQAGDSRSACKVCQGRHGKEFDLLKVDVVVRIIPPSHADVGGKKECNCHIMPVMAGES
ncbi:MAG: hypothetical protein FJZ01_07205 [Candidatus Sericytochromatia bacterium]|nr:hypothetical protein [Candidatus Tanganyikabacteria bacterium]